MFVNGGQKVPKLQFLVKTSKIVNNVRNGGILDPLRMIGVSVKIYLIFSR